MTFGEFFDYPGDDTTAPAAAGPVLGSDWTTERWTLLFSFTDILRVRSGERLIRRGDTDRSLYIVERGLLEAVVDIGGGGERRFPMEEGSIIGEVNFFDGGARSADVRAATDSQVRRLSLQASETMSARHPDLARDLLMDLGAILAFRLRRAEDLARA